ncbi:unnamed protein product [Schistosoma margrebowiei]|uniref:ATP-dependent RNA helicase n=1 Tax=Schistosoma margrebowiei TaxID=48269 RepID=A0A183NCA5_9TREM|nr:unnamed protein product [Schistosoma margrebowiei]
MVVGGNRQETSDSVFMLFGTRQQGVPVILRELMRFGGFDLSSLCFTVKEVINGLFELQIAACRTELHLKLNSSVVNEYPRINALKNQEWNSISRANILIGTPGRMAQHQTENSLLDMSNLKLLILDEADRLLDPTFRDDLEVILQNLTPDRQTLLFSATLTK